MADEIMTAPENRLFSSSPMVVTSWTKLNPV